MYYFFIPLILKFGLLECIADVCKIIDEMVDNFQKSNPVIRPKFDLI